MNRYPVIAELVDYRDGSRHLPAIEGEDPVLFAPEDDEHAARLIAAGCLEDEPIEGEPDSTEPVDDGLDALGVFQLAAHARKHQIDLGTARSKVEILAVIRAASHKG